MKKYDIRMKNRGIFKLDNKFSEDLLCIVFLQCMFAFFLFFNLNTVFRSSSIIKLFYLVRKYEEIDQTAA